MNTVIKLISELTCNGVQLSLNKNNEVAVKAPKNFWKERPDLLEVLKSNKDNLKNLLSIKENLALAKVNRDNNFNQLSYAQKRMWFHQQIHLDSFTYNMPICFRINGSIDFAKAEKALDSLLNRHESLRMGFHAHIGEPQQFIAKVSENWNILQTIELNSLADANDAIQNFVRIPFNLQKPPLIKSLLISISPDDHVFVINFHHIIADGQSLKIFFDEFCKFYNDEVESITYDKFDYCDYSFWHNNWLTSDGAREQLNYWKERLQGLESSSEITGDKVRPMAQTFSGKTFSMQLENHVVRLLNEFCKQSGFTLFSILLAAYACLSCKYTGEAEIVVGTPASGRTRPEFENVIGLFVNSLPLRINYDSSLTFKELCINLSKQLANDIGAQDYPFDKLVDQAVKRDISKNPLFQTMFIIEHSGVESIKLGSAVLSRHVVDLGATQLDLNFGVNVGENKIGIEIEYNTNIYTSAWIQSFLNNFNYLLQQVLLNNTVILKSLLYVKPEELNKLMQMGGITNINLNASTANLAYLIENNNYSDKLAIACDEITLTYTQLKAQSDNVAKNLIKMGMKAGDIVAVKMSRSASLIVAMIGILKANGTYLPIDPKYPVKRVEYVLSNSQSGWLIYDGKSDITKGITAKPILMDELIYNDSEANIELHYRDGKYPAYIIYTSGTTGLPKGVVVGHSGLINLCNAYQNHFGLSSPDCVSQFASQSFDTFGCEVWPALAVGASVFIVDEDTKLSPTDFIEFCDKHSITFSDIPTSIAPAIWAESIQPKMMKVMKIGGEKANKYPPDTLRYKIINTYGPTENTIESTYCIIHDPDTTKNNLQTAHKLPSIGKPLPGVGVMLIDRDGQPVPINATGEIIIFGQGLAEGYLNNQDMTQQKFDNFDIENTVLRGYRTGDLAKWHFDGQLEFVGRADKQVKIRNFRIELSEIEYAFNQLSDVAQSVVTVHGSKPEEKILVSYVILNQGCKTNSAELKIELKKFLPDYMVPAKIILINDFPLTINGKVDLNKLDELMLCHAESNESYVMPTTSLEHTMVHIWQNVLNLNKVGINDNFFEIGGDSLSSIRIVAHAAEQGVRIKPLHIHQYQTISAILANLTTDNTKPTIVRTEQSENRVIYPLSPIQQWFFNQEFHTPSHYNQSLIFIPPHHYDHQINSQLAEWLLNQHAILSIRFTEDNKHALLDKELTAASIVSNITLEDVHSADEFSKQVEDICNKVQEDFCIYTGPLFKLLYVHEEASNFRRLCIVAHHLVIDAVSWQIIKDNINYFLREIKTKSTVSQLNRSDSYFSWVDNILKLTAANDNSFNNELNKVHNKQYLSFGNTELRKTYLNTQMMTSVRTIEKKMELKFHEILLILCSHFVAAILDKKDVKVEFESHGRYEELVVNMDLTRTIGWFTVIYPGEINTISVADSINSIMTIAKIPDIDKLRYLLDSYSDTVSSSFDLSFNFHGDLREGTNDNASLLLSAPEKITNQIGLANHRSAIFDINAYINSEGLQIELSYPKDWTDKVGSPSDISSHLASLIAKLFVESTLNDSVFQNENSRIA